VHRPFPHVFLLYSSLDSFLRILTLHTFRFYKVPLFCALGRRTHDSSVSMRRPFSAHVPCCLPATFRADDRSPLP
jgi:hypothetical protein